MAVLRKMNSVKGNNLFPKFNVPGIEYAEERQPARYICACGTVTNSARFEKSEQKCPSCGNSTFQAIRPYYTSRSGSYVATEENKFYTSEDDAAISKGKLCVNQLVIIADQATNTFFCEENYAELFTVSDTGLSIAYQNLNKLSNEHVLKLVEKYKKTVMTPYQQKLYEEAKQRLIDWGIVSTEELSGTPKIEKTPEVERYLKILMMMQHYIHTGEFTIPEKDLYAYRHLVCTMLRNQDDRVKTLLPIDSIDRVIEIQKLPKFAKPYYANAVCGAKIRLDNRSYSYKPEQDEKLTVMLKNSLLYALMHGQLNIFDVTQIIGEIHKKPAEFQDDFVDFFAKHVNIFKSSVLNQFIMLREIAEKFPEQPAKFDMKSVSILEMVRWMKNKKINDVRAEMVVEALEKDPIVALKLISQKKRLSDEEKAMIDSLK